MQRILDLVGWGLFLLATGLLCLFALAVVASAAFADCTPLDPSQPYDASAGKFSGCSVDPDGVTASCEVLLIGEDGVSALVPIPSPAVGAIVTFDVPKGIYGSGAAITDCQDGQARRASAVLYPHVTYPPAPTAGKLMLTP